VCCWPGNTAFEPNSVLRCETRETKFTVAAANSEGDWFNARHVTVLATVSYLPAVLFGSQNSVSSIQSLIFRGQRSNRLRTARCCVVGGNGTQKEAVKKISTIKRGGRECGEVRPDLAPSSPYHNIATYRLPCRVRRWSISRTWFSPSLSLCIIQFLSIAAPRSFVCRFEGWQWAS
jgi:hypothetical protein